MNFTELTGVRPVTTAIAYPNDIVGIIASEVLSAEIARYYLTVPLYPDTLVSTIDKFRPTFIVVERAALYDGSWFGVESESGGLLIEEILRIEKWSTKHGRTFIYIDNDWPDQNYSHEIRNSAHVRFPSQEFWLAMPEQPRRRKIFHVASDYSERTNND
ncbi:hypothetical protein AAFM46_10480 [Arthrobacter sp. TMP15]|uniref:hypothetical protein n=1 Tax=Arthrobacter sp. TMP15 TaxID=3140789 RepID=UPI0031BA158D